MTEVNSQPVVQLKRMYRVRIRRAGFPPYSYNERATSSLELWLTAYERATAGRPENEMPPSVTVMRLRNVRPSAN